jgi:hypothetical protein
VKRHPLEPFSLVFGATFALLGGVFLFGSPDVTRLHLQWVWPIPLIALGLLIVVLAVRREAGSARGEPL